MMNKRQRLLAVAAAVLPVCSARTWVDLVDPVIYAAATHDPYRVKYMLEKDPFDYEGNDSVTSGAKVVNTAPTMAPTRRDEMVLENGGCPMDHFLYRIRLHDRWGDGWENVPIRILEMPHNTNEAIHEEYTGEYNATHTYSTETSVKKTSKLRQSSVSPVVIFEDSMGQGYDGYSYVCLKANQCYKAAMDSGLWDGEIKWDVQSALRPKGIVTVAKGVAPTKCQFSITESTNTTICSNLCEAGMDEVDSSSITVPSDFPSMVPSSAPSGGDAASVTFSDIPSLLPSTEPSEDVSDPPSLTPTNSV